MKVSQLLEGVRFVESNRKFNTYPRCTRQKPNTYLFSALPLFPDIFAMLAVFFICYFLLTAYLKRTEISGTLATIKRLEEEETRMRLVRSQQLPGKRRGDDDLIRLSDYDFERKIWIMYWRSPLTAEFGWSKKAEYIRKVKARPFYRLPGSDQGVEVGDQIIYIKRQHAPIKHKSKAHV